MARQCSTGCAVIQSPVETLPDSAVELALTTARNSRLSDYCRGKRAVRT